MRFIKVLQFIASRLMNSINRLRCLYYEKQFGYCSSTSFIGLPSTTGDFSKVYMYENSYILSGANFIISCYGNEGKLIIKKNVAASHGLTVVTGNHKRTIGRLIKDSIADYETDKNVDIIVDEDVWIGANVTLLPGCHIGRGADIGAGSVIRSVIPPYSIVAGNPAKVIGFNMTPEDIVEHEKLLYNEGERLPLVFLKKNYDKYYIRRIPEIIKYLRT